nr:RNA-directed DNA polymerase, eukaryota [Tanacetum cinerariifolium]
MLCALMSNIVGVGYMSNTRVRVRNDLWIDLKVEFKSSFRSVDGFVSIPDEGDMAFLRKKVKSEAAVRKRVLLQVVLRRNFLSSKDSSTSDLHASWYDAIIPITGEPLLTYMLCTIVKVESEKTMTMTIVDTLKKSHCQKIQTSVTEKKKMAVMVALEIRKKYNKRGSVESSKRSNEDGVKDLVNGVNKKASNSNLNACGHNILGPDEAHVSPIQDSAAFNLNQGQSISKVFNGQVLEVPSHKSESREAKTNSIIQLVESRSNKGSSKDSEANLNDTPRTTTTDTSSNNNMEKDEGKSKWVRELVRAERPLVVGLQETKMDQVNEPLIQYMWGSGDFEYEKVDAIGSAGGIVLIWDNTCFVETKAMGDEGYLAVVGN